MKKILLFLFLVVLVIIIFYSQNSSATSPYLGNIGNIKICQDTGGKYLNINFKPPDALKWGYSVGYFTKDIFCKCGENQFIKVTTINDWKGCNSTLDFMTESQFLEELNKIKSSASSVNGDMEEKYIKILEETIELEKKKQLINSLVIILIVTTVILYLGYRIYRTKHRKNKLKEFFKPTRWKTIMVVILLLLALAYLWSRRFLLFSIYDPILWFLALPIMFIQITGINFSNPYVSTIIIFVLQIIYWYILACFIMYLLGKIKKKK